jgi:hypothetical protein
MVASWGCGGDQHVPIRKLMHTDDAQGYQKAEQYQQTAPAAKRRDDHLLVSTHFLNRRHRAGERRRPVGWNRHSDRGTLEGGTGQPGIRGAGVRTDAQVSA